MENSDSESLELRGLANLPRWENGASILNPWKKNEALYRIGFLFTFLTKVCIGKAVISLCISCMNVRLGL